MNSQKLENVLGLALDSTASERERSLELNVGYDANSEKWDVIVKYSGSLVGLREEGIDVVELLGGYAILTLTEEQLQEVTELPQIEFIEKPKRLFFQVEAGKNASCIPPVRRSPFNLTGEGILVAVIDSGIDYRNREFRNADGSTRIRAIWDQTLEGNAPQGYNRGTEYTMEEINQALSSRTAGYDLVLTQDVSGHGTAVAGIAAGNSGVAPKSELLIVKMGVPKVEGFPRTTELMQGVDYAIRKALELQKPVAINLSFGNTYGAHDGTSLLERFLDNISEIWKNVICIGTGNEGDTAGHVRGRLTDENEARISLAVQELEPTLNVQIWKAYYDRVDISIISPSGVRVGPIQETLGTQRFVLGETEILLYYGEPSPFSIDQEIYLDFLPRNNYINAGVWQLVLTPREVIRGDYALWLPTAGVLNSGTAFQRPSATGTQTIPSTAQRTIGVGAYDARTLSYAQFSGRGQAGLGRRLKPDIVAPGVNVTAPVPGGTFAEFSGTSFATPFVTGSAALLMQWGIANKNDPYLYGEKVRAYLQRGATPLPGFVIYPNEEVGYGALCVRDSLPK